MDACSFSAGQEEFYCGIVPKRLSQWLLFGGVILLLIWLNTAADPVMSKFTPAVIFVALLVYRSSLGRAAYYVKTVNPPALHKIIGVAHAMLYPLKRIERELSGSSHIIFEKIRLSGKKLPFKNYEQAGKIICFGLNQMNHANKLLRRGERIINIDVCGKKGFPFGNYGYFKYMLVFPMIMAFLIILCLYNPVFFKIALPLADIMLFTLFIFPCQFLFNIIKNVIIIIDFRNLVFAAKLAYLTEKSGSAGIVTTNVVGAGHAKGFRDYLINEPLRSKRWERYRVSLWLRYLLRQLDLQSSMEIWQEELVEDGEIAETLLGSIADVPGPKELLASMAGTGRVARGQGIFGNLGYSVVKGIKAHIAANKYKELMLDGVLSTTVPVRWFVMTGKVGRAPPIYIYEQLAGDGVLEIYFSSQEFAATFLDR
ncbi:MAG: hypothetical protein NTY47_04640, partial [Candidatus Omnitrophica bacterium]|nr:hypothetical protein [Candidatus Omnitrophota bacterium]